MLRIEIVKRSDNMKGFVVLPRRWVVERTFSWFGRNRRLARDFENLAETLATFVTLASIQMAPKAARQGVGRDDEGLQSLESRPSPTPRPAAESRRFRTSRQRHRPARFDPLRPFTTAQVGGPAGSGADIPIRLRSPCGMSSIMR